MASEITYLLHVIKKSIIINDSTQKPHIFWFFVQTQFHKLLERLRPLIPNKLRRRILRNKKQNPHRMQLSVGRFTICKFYRSDSKAPYVSLKDWNLKLVLQTASDFEKHLQQKASKNLKKTKNASNQKRHKTSLYTVGKLKA